MAALMPIINSVFFKIHGLYAHITKWPCVPSVLVKPEAENLVQVLFVLVINFLWLGVSRVCSTTTLFLVVFKSM